METEFDILVFPISINSWQMQSVNTIPTRRTSYKPMDELLQIFYDFKLIRWYVGGRWYLIADYNRDRQIWLNNVHSPQGIQILLQEDYE
jgi:hypothetical protein